MLCHETENPFFSQLLLCLRNYLTGWEFSFTDVAKVSSKVNCFSWKNWPLLFANASLASIESFLPPSKLKFIHLMVAGVEIVSTDGCRLMGCLLRLTRQDQSHVFPTIALSERFICLLRLTRQDQSHLVPNHCQREIHMHRFFRLQSQKHAIHSYGLF